VHLEHLVSANSPSAFAHEGCRSRNLGSLTRVFSTEKEIHKVWELVWWCSQTNRQTLRRAESINSAGKQGVSPCQAEAVVEPTRGSLILEYTVRPNQFVSWCSSGETNRTQPRKGLGATKHYPCAAYATGTGNVIHGNSVKLFLPSLFYCIKNKIHAW
jgi:hypothetical protein